MRFAYYPGCVGKSSAAEVDHATRRLAARLGIELVELDQASCCGATQGWVTDPSLTLALNARTLAQAEGLGLDVLTICNTCYLSFTRTISRLSHPGELARVNHALGAIGLQYQGRARVRPLPAVLLEDVGAADLRRQTRRPLEGLRIAPFYGCHLLRPAPALGADDGRSPHWLEDLFVALGAEAVDHPAKTQCCGFHILMTNEPLGARIDARVLQSARAAGAACVGTPCTQCYVTLDAFQKAAERESRTRFRLPILHVAEVAGIALGLSGRDLRLSSHMVSPRSLGLV